MSTDFDFDSEPDSRPDLEYLVVYGSLMREEGMLVTVGAVPYVQFVAEVQIPGLLFDLGEYPGLRLMSAGASPGVPAELFALRDPRALALLDEYEGYREENRAESPFVRQRLRLDEPDVEAWVYVYQGPVDHRPQVSGVSWPKYKAGRDRRPPVSRNRPLGSSFS